MKNSPVIHPFLFAVFPILFLFAHNVGQVSFSEILLPTTIVLGFTLLLLLLSGLVLKNSKKAGIFVSFSLVLFFSYGHVLEGLLHWWLIGRISHTLLHAYLLLSWGILFICGAYFIIKIRRDLHNATNILNIVATFLVVISLINIVPYKIKTWAISRNIKSTESIGINAVDSMKEDILPDIYYIILDRYASTSTLKEVYHFDNSEFINYLSNKGFYVAFKSRANYPCTAQSLAASLNMEYINYLSDKVGKESNDHMPIFAMLQDYKVWHFLKSKGYKFIHFGSGWGPMSRNKYADINFNLPLSLEFPLLLYRTTMFYPIDTRFSITELGNRRLRQWKRVLYKFDKLAEMPSIKDPTFVFVHMNLPHEPFVFDRNGKFLSKEEAKKRSRAVNYLDQLIFANKKIKVLIDKLLSKSQSPPIIILQSDEGPDPQRYLNDRLNFDWREASETELRQKTRILNAYYLPNIDKNVLYSSITPVNSFRLIFNIYLNTHLELLPDRTYAFVNQRYIYDLFDVTGKVKYD